MMKNQEGFIGNDELVSRILINLNIETLKNCRQVCKQWNRLISDRFFWKHKAENESSGSSGFKFVPMNSQLPWTFYATVYLYKPFGRNLIQNPCGLGIQNIR